MEESGRGVTIMGLSAKHAGLIVGLLVLGVAVWLLARNLGASPPTIDGIEIRFLDVGQGDAALISSADGRHILIDAGPNPYQVEGYLRNHHIDSLDLVIASHNHADHVGGMPEVLKHVKVLNYMDNGLPAATGLYRKIVDLLTERNIRVLSATPRVLTIGSMTIEILPLPPPTGTQNNESIGVVVKSGEFKALFTGDSQVEEISYWLAVGAVTPVTVIKIAHHGSDDATTPDWVRATGASLAVISVGANNEYGHPGEKTVLAWESPTRRVLRTDRDGTIIVSAWKDGRFEVRSSAKH